MKKEHKILLKFGLYILTFLVIIGIGVSNIFAETYDAYLFNAQLYDNNNGSLSTVSTSFGNNYWQGTIPNMTANSSGAAWGISSPIPLIANHTYTLTVNIGHEYGNTVLSTYNRIGVGSSFNEAKISYQNNSNVVENLSKVQSLVYGQGLQFAFTPSISGNYIVFPFATSLSGTNVKFTLNQITLDDIGSTGVTETTINNSLNNQTNVINGAITNSQNNIINNQNITRDAIINNQNSNTQQQIESQKVCNDILVDKNSITLDNYRFGTSGNLIEYNGSGITNYYTISSNTNIVIKRILSDAYSRLCFYNQSKEIISCTTLENYSQNDILTIPSNSKYVRFTIVKNSNLPQYSFSECKDGNQAISDNLNGLNDNINDDNTDGATSEASDFFSDFNTNTFGLTSIITAPLNLIQSLTSKTCTPLHLPLPYLNNKYLDLPCMSTIYSQHFGTFFTLYQTITYGIIAYWVVVRIFNHVKDFKNPEHDEIEVVDL